MPVDELPEDVEEPPPPLTSLCDFRSRHAFACSTSMGVTPWPKSCAPLVLLSPADMLSRASSATTHVSAKSDNKKKFLMFQYCICCACRLQKAILCTIEVSMIPKGSPNNCGRFRILKKRRIPLIHNTQLVVFHFNIDTRSYWNTLCWLRPSWLRLSASQQLSCTELLCITWLRLVTNPRKFKCVTELPDYFYWQLKHSTRRSYLN